jgi:hypothetical protein
MHTCNNSQGAGIYSFTRKIPGAIHTITHTQGAGIYNFTRDIPSAIHTHAHTQGAGIYNFTRDIPGADLDPALKPIIFPYIDLNLQVGLNTE